MESAVLDPPGEALLVDDAASALLDAVAGIDKSVASLLAMRARMIDQSRAWMEASAAASPLSRGPHADGELARQLLVAELAPLLRIPAGSATHLVAESRSLVADLPATLEALGRGEMSYRHAQVVIENAEDLPDEARGEFEQAVLPVARTLNTSRFRERARRIRERIHPESLAARRASRFERRSVSVDPARDGMAWLSAYLPAEAAIAIDDRLDQLAAAMRDPADSRTFAQLRTDAFCEMLIAGEVPALAEAPGARSRGIQARGIKARVLVTVPVLTLMGLDDEPASLEGYGPIPADVARLLAAGAPSFMRLLTHPETGVVLSVGRDSYAVPSALRLWLRVRDETCRAVGCGRRAATSDVDHGHDWAKGGQTAGDNLAHLCRGDHTRKHRLGWRMEHLPGGFLRWTSPMGRSYLTEPSTVLRT
jgi:hypothetical protein